MHNVDSMRFRRRPAANLDAMQLNWLWASLFRLELTMQSSRLSLSDRGQCPLTHSMAGPGTLQTLTTGGAGLTTGARAAKLQ